MGITRAIGNAVTGLSANARAAEIVSRNLANAGVEGYTAKRLHLSHAVAGAQGAGVRVDGVGRSVDVFATLARRAGDARAELAGGEAQTLRRLADLVIDPDGGDGLQARLERLDAALAALADTPESAENRVEAAAAAGGAAKKLNMLSGEVVRLRAELDAEIARQVAQVNAAVRRIETLNREIEAAQASGRDATGLEDERQRQVDLVNRIIPIRATPENNASGLLTAAGGGTLAPIGDGPLSFQTTAAVDGTSAMGGLMLDVSNATPVAGPAGAQPFSPLVAGGSLEALFRARDVHAPALAGRLDDAARDLIERFQNLPGWSDPPDAPGLFVNGTAALAAGDPTAGLAGRIALNPEVDPDAGGDPALLASGLFGGRLAPQPGADPYPAALRAAALSQTSPARASIVQRATDIGAEAEAAAGRAENEAGYARGAAMALLDNELERQSVDTDAELQDLLRVERAYAANARVLQVVDEMLSRLLEI